MENISLREAYDLLPPEYIYLRDLNLPPLITPVGKSVQGYLGLEPYPKNASAVSLDCRSSHWRITSVGNTAITNPVGIVWGGTN